MPTNEEFLKSFINRVKLYKENKNIVENVTIAESIEKSRQDLDDIVNILGFKKEDGKSWQDSISDIKKLNSKYHPDKHPESQYIATEAYKEALPLIRKLTEEINKGNEPSEIAIGGLPNEMGDLSLEEDLRSSKSTIYVSQNKAAGLGVRFDSQQAKDDFVKRFDQNFRMKAHNTDNNVVFILPSEGQGSTGYYASLNNEAAISFSTHQQAMDFANYIDLDWIKAQSQVEIGNSDGFIPQGRAALYFNKEKLPPEPDITKSKYIETRQSSLLCDDGKLVVKFSNKDKADIFARSIGDELNCILEERTTEQSFKITESKGRGFFGSYLAIDPNSKIAHMAINFTSKEQASKFANCLGIEVGQFEDIGIKLASEASTNNQLPAPSFTSTRKGASALYFDPSALNHEKGVLPISGNQRVNLPPPPNVQNPSGYAAGAAKGGVAKGS
mgnify:CR=1 FL=1